MYNGQQDDYDEEEEGDVKDDAIDLILVPGRILDLITDATASPNANIHVEHITLHTSTQTNTLEKWLFLVLIFLIEPNLNINDVLKG